MSGVHLHLLLNHIPLLLGAFATILLALAMLRRSDELKKVSLGAFVIAGLIAVPVYLTGEPAEEAVEKLPGVSEAIIGRHEDAALIALIMMGTLGVAALVGLLIFRKDRRIPLWFSGGALLLSLAAVGVMGWTANLGGQIRHSEIREGAASVPSSREDQEKEEKRGKEEKSDEDDK